ncbi:MAG: hypothetical protein IPI84_04335 [Holophagaceae bacterium]|nr:hypothetical protein [Holophagaceae bacterium]
MRTTLIPAVLAGTMLLALGCNHKSEAALQAEEAAKAAEARVAQLEQQLAEAKSGKATGEDAETVQQVTKSQVKALERQVADAKKRAEVQKQEAAHPGPGPPGGPEACGGGGPRWHQARDQPDPGTDHREGRGR